MLSFGALFLANPDLPARLRTAGPYNAPDKASFFGGDDKGYPDYPALAD
jgi:N-ethylmaleimide reductase